MTGMKEFLEVFGKITILDVTQFLMGAAFIVIIGKKLIDYIAKRVKASEEKDRQLKEALEVVSNYPKYRQQSLDIQAKLTGQIEGLTSRLEEIEAARNASDLNHLRDRLIQIYKYYTDPKRNPDLSWNQMESDAFWEMFGEYERKGGDGYIHSKVEPAMKALTVIEM